VRGPARTHVRRLRHRGATADVALLRGVLDRARSRLAHALARGAGSEAELDQQPSRDRSGAPEPAHAVKDDALAPRQATAQPMAGVGPPRFEQRVGDARVPDRQVVPFEAERLRVPPERRDAERLDLGVLYQRDQRRGAGVADHAEVLPEVAVPVRENAVALFLAWAQREADAATHAPGRTPSR
jgi:hypothetical protein